VTTDVQFGFSEDRAFAAGCCQADNCPGQANQSGARMFVTPWSDLMRGRRAASTCTGYL
jgi:hypothetical protein